MSNVRDIDILKTWLLSDSLNFTRYFFKVRFKRKFVIGPHHRMIADALNDVLTGKTRKLFINISPRYGKTEQAVKNFIANGLAFNPAAKFIHISYSDDLVLDNSKDIQSLMLEPEYQRLFSAKPTTPNAKKWYTKEHGGLYAVSSAGQVTGFGAGLVDDAEAEEEDNTFDEFTTIEDATKFGGAIIVDDAMKPDDVFSDKIRTKINTRFDTTIRSRVNSRKTPIIIIGHRLHCEDLFGYLLAKEPNEWKILSIPCIRIINGKDEALWPFKQTLDELHALQKIDPYTFSSQYMQNAYPITGGHIKKDWFMFCDSAPKNLAWDLWIDGAYTDKKINDPSGFMFAGFDVTNGRLYIKYYISEWLTIPDVLKKVKALVKEHGDQATMIYIEPKASGYSFIQMIQEETFLNVTRITGRLVQDGKTARVKYAAPKVESSRVWLERGNWNNEFITQLTAFPNYAHDEVCDLLGYAVRHYFG